MTDQDLNLVIQAAKVGCGVESSDLFSRTKVQPVAFVRHLCICALSEELGYSQEDSCKAFGRNQACYKQARRSLIKKLREETDMRCLAHKFHKSFETFVKERLKTPITQPV